MHVLIIPSEHFVTDKSPLAGIFQSDLANLLASNSVKVGVIAPGFISPRFLLSTYPFAKVESLNSLNILRQYQRRVIPEKYRSAEVLVRQYTNLGMKLYDEYVAIYGVPDLVHAHGFLFAGSVAARINKQNGVRTVITEHSSSYLRNLIEHKYLDEIRRVADSAVEVSAVSAALAQAIENILDNPKVTISVLPNQLPKLEDRPTRSGDVDLGSGCRFISIGSLDSNKNHQLLIKAFAKLAIRENVTLKIVGAGPLKKSLEKLSRELRIENRVFFTGQKTRYEVSHLLANSDCLVVSSKVETFGVVILEAFSAGIPVISTRCGGPEELIDSSNGLLVDSSSVDEMALAMEQIRCDYAKFDTKNLVNDVEKNYGQSRHLRSVMDFYRLALGQSEALA